jgi:hypothetical protein
MTQPEERPTAQEIAASIEEAALQPDPSAFEIAVANSARLLMSTAGPAENSPVDAARSDDLKEVAFQSAVGKIDVQLPENIRLRFLDALRRELETENVDPQTPNRGLLASAVHARLGAVIRDLGRRLEEVVDVTGMHETAGIDLLQAVVNREKQRAIQAMESLEARSAEAKTAVEQGSKKAEEYMTDADERSTQFLARAKNAIGIMNDETALEELKMIKAEIEEEGDDEIEANVYEAVDILICERAERAA